ncbi:nickel pincer cofactor biosynthesis protein LarC [Desulforamulus aquiferis]|uniref:Pyridinium-3,5-bisthiocarboxylic acid mononucleotide nickel insertion protein n=1 Tax=Desulforamulus aquiferis TaxID=1397668 RepID=A0AAW7ZIB4_9FIRM|nr:nickel pincer cofactor biosynthesis protein LarC [Desulforamulus aquiferis]MDO7789080.1 nickel pincer cofactor biosynthesis protein LarC [Desulforamulus aquiferis]
MKVLYYDCFCGISGDMNLGALLDLGVDEDYLRQEISKLNLDTEYELHIKKDNKRGISGTRVDVVCHHNHEHHHNEAQTSHKSQNSHNNHEHRNLKDIENIIINSNLNDKVKNLSLAIFNKVAEAEAKVHGKPLYEVHFHEVGAVDSIIDIVGAAVCIEFLKVDKIMASSVQVGGGFVKCAHGIIPVPAPATVEILKNAPVKFGIVPFETTTPTGAAILAANVCTFTDHMTLSIEKVGYGIGHRELEIPNVLRIYLGYQDRDEAREEQYILETNIDDMNPELYGYIEEKLFAQGALDVFKSAITMKKGRAATKLSVLVKEIHEKSVVDVIFRETTSIGVRKYKVEKIMLPRDFIKINTKYGSVNVKNAYYQGEKVKYKPEFEDCKRIAIERNIPIAKVYQEVHKIMEADNNC